MVSASPLVGSIFSLSGCASVCYVLLEMFARVVPEMFYRALFSMSWGDSSPAVLPADAVMVVVAVALVYFTLTSL